LPGWPIHRLHRAGWPSDRPLATIEPVRGQLRVAQACPRATEAGVTPAMPLTQARALCPDLMTADADPDADRQALTRLAAWCERFTPLAAPDPPDGLWLDITGCAHLHGSEEAMLHTLIHRLAGQQTTRAALTGTAGASWALARAATRPALQIIPPGQEPQALAPLPVALLRLDPRITASLRRVGLRSIGELARQPRADLAARFGIKPGLRLDQAFGTASEAIMWPRPPSDWSEHLAFPEPIGTPEDLARALTLLSERLCDRLEADSLGALHVTAQFLKLGEERPGALPLDPARSRAPGPNSFGGHTHIGIATARPLRDAQRLARLLTAKLDTIDPGLGVEAIFLTATLTAPLTPSQPHFNGPPASEALTTLIDDIANRIGPDRIWRAAPYPSHVPERATTTTPPLTPTEPWPLPPGPRPIRRLRPPEPIEATAPVPDDPPILFRWRRALHRVRAASGPERIAAEWWRRSPEPYRFRDYYYVEDTTGARFWLFRTGLPGDVTPTLWFLHGLFG